MESFPRIRTICSYLRRHDFSICSTNLHPSIQTGAQMCLNYGSSVDLSVPDTTVVGSLGSRESALWPSEWEASVVYKGVLLFQSEPGLVLFHLLHNLQCTKLFIYDHKVCFRNQQQLGTILIWKYSIFKNIINLFVISKNQSLPHNFFKKFILKLIKTFLTVC